MFGRRELIRTYLFRLFFFSSRRRHTRSTRDWSSDVCSSDLPMAAEEIARHRIELGVDQPRDVAREDRLEPILGNVPAHDVEALRPGVLARRNDEIGRAVV